MTKKIIGAAFIAALVLIGASGFFKPTKSAMLVENLRRIDDNLSLPLPEEVKIWEEKIAELATMQPEPATAATASSAEAAAQMVEISKLSLLGLSIATEGGHTMVACHYRMVIAYAANAVQLLPQTRGASAESLASARASVQTARAQCALALARVQ